jgi:hypothetical protein
MLRGQHVKAEYPNIAPLLINCESHDEGKDAANADSVRIPRLGEPGFAKHLRIVPQPFVNDPQSGGAPAPLVLAAEAVQQAL